MDLNLVRTFVTLYECRSVTAAATRLHLTQPTVSYALARLRRHFDDPLFVRDATGMRPTVGAQRLYPPLSAALHAMDDTLAQAERFEPAHATQRFRLALSDLGELALLPEILARITAAAPAVSVEVVALDVERAGRDLARGEIDAAICSHALDRDDLHREPLFAERYVGLACGDHPRIGNTPTTAAYLAERHVRVDAGSGHGLAARVLAEQGAHRRIGLVVPRFASLPAILASSDLLAIVPLQIAHRFARAGTLRVFELPLAVPAFDVALYSHAVSARSAPQRWFRETVRDAACAAALDVDDPS